MPLPSSGIPDRGLVLRRDSDVDQVARSRVPAVKVAVSVGRARIRWRAGLFGSDHQGDDLPDNGFRPALSGRMAGRSVSVEFLG